MDNEATDVEAILNLSVLNMLFQTSSVAAVCTFIPFITASKHSDKLKKGIIDLSTYIYEF